MARLHLRRRSFSFPCCGAALWLLMASLASPAAAETYRTGPDDAWFDRLSGDDLQPGDEVVLTRGTYSDPRRLVVGHRGTAERPIVIRAAEGHRVVFQRPDARQNTLNLEGAEYLELRDLEITGGAAGIRIRPVADEPVRGIVLQGIHVHHIGGVAVTCNHPGAVYEQMRFRRNHIHHTGGHGEAFYLGGNDGTAVFRDSVVELNYIHDLRGESVSQGDGVELKQGSYGNRVAGNVIHDTQYPGIIVYGTDDMPPNVIEQNLIWNTGDHGIQAAADAVIRHNFVADAGGAGIYSRDHQQAVVGNLTIQENVILRSRAEAIRIQRPSGAEGAGEYSGPVVIADNYLRGADPAVTDPRQLLRIDETPQVSIRGNDVGLPSHLPSLEGNPAWQHLQRETVRSRLVPGG